MSGLWRKEFRSTLPFFALAVFIPALGLLYELFTGPPHLKPWSATYEEYVVSSRESSVVICLFILALASGLLVREYDDGTMEFLDSLPVSRSRVFLAKVSMAMLVVLLLTVLDASTTLLLHAFSQTSLDSSFHWRFWLTAIFMRTCQGFILLGLGVACSFLRRFGWLVIGLLFWAYLLLHEAMPSIAVLDLLSLASPDFEGPQWVIPRRQLTVQLTLGSVLMLTAYGLFLGWGDRLMRGFRGLTQSRWGNALLLGGSLLVGIVGFSLIYYVMEGEQDEGLETGIEDVTVEYPDWTTSRARTRHYEFLYPTNLSTRTEPLMNVADDVHAKVRDFLRADAGEPIVVDATSMLARHAGLAYWDKIRFDLTASEDVETLASILGHETTHVFLDRLSDSRLADKLNSTRFFHEGVATYVEFRLFQPEQGIDRLRQVAAVMRDRDEVHFEELVDSSLLAARRDTDLVYPLGEVFVDALVALHGEPAIGEIVRALARDDVPEDLTGLDLWRDVFQSRGYNLDDVLDEFFARLDAEVERHRDFIDRLPRLRGAVTTDAEIVQVRVVGEPPEGWQPICRFRQRRDTPDRSYIPGEPAGPNRFVAWREDFPGSTAWYQVGIYSGQDIAIYEPWTQIRLGD